MSKYFGISVIVGPTKELEVAREVRDVFLGVKLDVGRVDGDIRNARMTGMPGTLKVRCASREELEVSVMKTFMKARLCSVECDLSGTF